MPSTAGDPTKAIVRAASSAPGDAPSQTLPWLVSLSSGNGAAAPFVCTITPLAPASEPIPPLDAQVGEFWTSEANIPAATLTELGITGTTLEDFGVQGFSPPTGGSSSLLEAIDAAVLATVAILGPAPFSDPLLRLAIATAFQAWDAAGGTALGGGAGGPLQTVGLELG